MMLPMVDNFWQTQVNWITAIGTQKKKLKIIERVVKTEMDHKLINLVCCPAVTEFGHIILYVFLKQ